MADDVTVASGNNTSAPNGTKFATDEATGSRHVPLVVLAYSDSSGSLVSAGANGLAVSVSAGTVTLGGVASTATSASTALAYSTASGTALAANANRVGFNIYNVSSSTAYINFGTAANSTAALVRHLGQREALSDAQLGLYQGVISIIGSGSGTAVVTEW